MNYQLSLLLNHLLLTRRPGSHQTNTNTNTNTRTNTNTNTNYQMSLLLVHFLITRRPGSHQTNTNTKIFKHNKYSNTKNMQIQKICKYKYKYKLPNVPLAYPSPPHWKARQPSDMERWGCQTPYFHNFKVFLFSSSESLKCSVLMYTEVARLHIFKTSSFFLFSESLKSLYVKVKWGCQSPYFQNSKVFSFFWKAECFLLKYNEVARLHIFKTKFFPSSESLKGFYVNQALAGRVFQKTKVSQITFLF